MVFVLLSWFIIILMTVSIGTLVLYCVSLSTRSVTLHQFDLFTIFWTGLAAIIAISQLVSLFLPLETPILVLFLLASLAGLPQLFRYARRITPLVADIGNPSIVVVFAILALVAILYGANGVSTSWWSCAYDTDLYHFNIIRWLNEYAAVPGLGNLHSRLGHTSGFLIFSALIDNLWWDGHCAWITYALIITVVFVQWLWIIFFPGRDMPLRCRLFCLFTVPYMVHLITTTHPTLYFDEIALVIQLVLFSELMKYPFQSAVGKQEDGVLSPGIVPWLMSLATLAVLGFSVKPIGALSLAAILIIDAIFLLKYTLPARTNRLRVVKPAIAVYAIAALILVGHVSRNTILTGWLLYPAPFGNIHSEWSMPKYSDGTISQMQSVMGQYEIIKAWARLPGRESHMALTKGFSFWFPKWRNRVWKGIEPLCLYLGCAFILLHVISLAMHRKGKREILWDLVLIAISAANLVYWFTSAPDMRFGRAFFWIWAGVGGTLFFSGAFIKPSIAYALTTVAVFYALTAMTIYYIPWNHHPTLWTIGTARSRRVKKIIIDNDQHPPLMVYVPKTGDQCGDSLIPCTPYPSNALQFRKPGNLQAGFMIKGNK